MTISRSRSALAAEAISLFSVCFASACVSDADPPIEGNGANGGESSAGGTSSTGNAGSGGGTSTGNGGTASSGDEIRDNPAFGMGISCLPITQALISDFTVPAVADAGASDAGTPPTNAVTFGDFTSQFSGGTFQYPGEGMYAVTADMSSGAWHLSGNIGDYSGFGLYLSVPPTLEDDTGTCNVIDASDYRGISFTVSGNVAMGGFLQFIVGTSEDDISHLWLDANVAGSMALPNSGTCLPATGQYDGTCASPSFNAPVTEEPTTVTVLWENLLGGLPRPSVDPAKITSIVWVFPPPPGAGTAAPTPYAADVTIDDLSFVP